MSTEKSGSGVDQEGVRLRLTNQQQEPPTRIPPTTRKPTPAELYDIFAHLIRHGELP